MEKSIAVIQNRCIWWLLQVPILAIGIGILLSQIFHEDWTDTSDGYIISGVIFGICLVIILVPYMIGTRDVFSSAGILRTRRKKVIRELKWVDVKVITYNKFGFKSLFVYMQPWVCYVILDNEVFETSFSRRELKKIQLVIPIKIDVR